MKPKNIMLSQRSLIPYTKKVRTVCFHLYDMMRFGEGRKKLSQMMVMVYIFKSLGYTDV